MSLPFRFLFSLAILCLATGCEIDRVLTINPDGSGQIHERFLASRDSYMQKAPPRAKDDKSPIILGSPGLPLPTGEFIVKKATEYGEGVDVVSFKRIEDGNMLGYEADYTFADVTKIRADAFLQNSNYSDASSEKPTPPDSSRNFQFTKGEVSELRLPLKLAKSQTSNGAKTTETLQHDPKQDAAMIDAIKHFNMRMAIRVQGKIEETNSHFRKDNEVIVSEKNIKGMAADPKHAQEFKDAESGKTPPEEALKDERYVKDESVDVLTIRFR